MARTTSLTTIGCALALTLLGSCPIGADEQTPGLDLRLVSSRVTLAGTSNLHDYTASTAAARVVRLHLTAEAAGDEPWDAVMAAGALDIFEIAIPAATLTSPREGLDKNMHKALRVTEFPDITFTLGRLEPGASAGTHRATGTLRLAGVERDVTLVLSTTKTGATFTVRGQVPLLMTDFGIAPPKAMLGMLKTSPNVTVTFETVFGLPRT